MGVQAVHRPGLSLTLPGSPYETISALSPSSTPSAVPFRSSPWRGYGPASGPSRPRTPGRPSSAHSASPTSSPAARAEGRNSGLASSAITPRERDVHHFISTQARSPTAGHAALYTRANAHFFSRAELRQARRGGELGQAFEELAGAGDAAPLRDLALLEQLGVSM